MILPIYIYGHPVLRKVAEDITPDYPGLPKLLEDMWKTMYECDGVGLAAPQVGKSIRIFVIDGSGFEEIDPACSGFKKTFINAHILEHSEEEEIRNEGCLSIPGIHEDVPRWKSITIRYMDENGTEHTDTYDGIRAMIVQHEYDHLEGKMFTDYLSPLKKRLLKGKLANLSLGKFSPAYRVVLP